MEFGAREKRGLRAQDQDQERVYSWPLKSLFARLSYRKIKGKMLINIAMGSNIDQNNGFFMYDEFQSDPVADIYGN